MPNSFNLCVPRPITKRPVDIISKLFDYSLVLLHAWWRRMHTHVMRKPLVRATKAHGGLRSLRAGRASK
jgi:hypothetical protein